MPIVSQICLFPLKCLGGIEDDIERKHFRFIFFFGCRKIQLYLSAEIRRHLLRLRYGSNGVETICVRIQCLLYADVVPAIDFLPFVCARPYGALTVKCRVGRGQALLAI